MDKYKNRTKILEDTILELRRFFTANGFSVNAIGNGTSGAATEVTLTLVKNAVELLSTIVNNGNANSLIRFDKDGNVVTVSEDSVTPSNNTPLPVKITSTSGDINITAGDLNVQLSHTGTNPDSIRIGDGTNELTINSDGSINAIIKEENRLSRYSISRTDSTSSIEYYGFVATDNNWYIMQIDTTTEEYKYANGNSDFLTNWGNRTTLTYDEYNNLTW